ncbi:MAG: hypothetical protein JXB13_01720 [Phycisphaerae bacterium]|nr:hypothetical protein [Phycisphaerae bacterium]
MDWDLYRELRKEGQAERQALRAAAQTEFERVKVLAFAHGLILRRHTEAHYTLAAGAAGDYVWLWDVYPGKRRIKVSRRHPGTPFLDVPPAWTLRDVVAAAIRIKEGDSKPGTRMKPTG